MDIDSFVQTATVYAIPVLFAISLHEAAHGFVARYFGDPTAAEAGRLTINPLKHIDPFGTILLPLVLALVHLPPLGFAKPVPVDYGRLRNPKKQMAFVAAAGPAANFVMGLAWMVLWIVLIQVFHFTQDDFFIKMAEAGWMVNAAMFVFNLIPLPPLDGGRIVTGILPMSLARPYARIERYSMWVFIGLILAMQFGLLNGFLIRGMYMVHVIWQTLVYPLQLLFT
ncbi:site-2 protease family protein [Pseudoduganella sp. FT25W]|jgi:Zn-dependent protease|uniref:Site-2 protease family protein n=1 Tax=Duganella alba TaxID=2666081 RepID=A0A6L5QFG8_9BURK|nr:site-2 protease family protein [Duganella alba]MRX08278.1 site-2 protease family protein [Duganella alba]MRX16817.1 site-2 protease family protein [Duganella alba]